MKLQQRIDLFDRLGQYLDSEEDDWKKACQKAFEHNPWFTPEFISLAIRNVKEEFLNTPTLNNWAQHYYLDDNIDAKTVGIVMAGNIPLVGFHDMLAVFISGHNAVIKLSSKDDTLLKFLIEKLYEFEPDVKNKISFSERLTGCDAYIATGSNNSSRYFEYYFGKYPAIIRKNKTSVAVLTGNENTVELECLSDDVHVYFGLGCRNVTKIYLPCGYDFIPLLKSFDKYEHLRHYQRYQNNYDYRLSILLLNRLYYMTNGVTILSENPDLFSPISVLHYEYYDNKADLDARLAGEPDLQCIVSRDRVPFGRAQRPSIFDYADGVDTMQFLLAM